MQLPLTIQIFSTVTGEVFQVGDVIDNKHWVKRLIAPVLFVDAFKEAMKLDGDSYAVVEVGPKPVLMKLAKSIKLDNKKLQWVVSLEEGVPTNLDQSLASF